MNGEVHKYCHFDGPPAVVKFDGLVKTGVRECQKVGQIVGQILGKVSLTGSLTESLKMSFRESQKWETLAFSLAFVSFLWPLVVCCSLLRLDCNEY